MRVTQITSAIFLLGITTYGVVSGVAGAKSEPPIVSPSQERLLAAYRANNTSLLRRIGQRMGSHRVSKQIETADRLRVIAAISATNGPDDRWFLLPTLARAAAHPDRTIAIAAAAQAAQLSADLDPLLLEEQEISRFELSTWQGDWLQVAAETTRWMDIRVLSFEIAVDLYRLQPKNNRAPLNWVLFLDDKNPTMRAAAINRLPLTSALQSQITMILQSDSSPNVALSAGQWLCGSLGGSQRPNFNLDKHSTERLITLATNKAHSIARRSDVASCLIRDGSLESRRALAALLQQSPPSLREPLKAQIRGE